MFARMSEDGDAEAEKRQHKKTMVLISGENKGRWSNADTASQCDKIDRTTGE
jgi:hypothetical protein